jgi:hypothetical protein
MMTKDEAFRLSYDRADKTAADMTGVNPAPESQVRASVHHVGFDDGAEYERNRAIALVYELERTVELTVESIDPRQFGALIARLAMRLRVDIETNRTP